MSADFEPVVALGVDAIKIRSTYIYIFGAVVRNELPDFADSLQSGLLVSG